MYSEKEVLLSSIFPSLEAAIFTSFFCVCGHWLPKEYLVCCTVEGRKLHDSLSDRFFFPEAHWLSFLSICLCKVCNLLSWLVMKKMSYVFMTFQFLRTSFGIFFRKL